ncbi:unnamed protein product [Durusdinium trenchii]|uniref:Uncharacterized protein n=2 Tax=Durusdinium trenchii TaxID=1381693 RepID=A0ABP0L8X7_9DINO
MFFLQQWFLSLCSNLGQDRPFASGIGDCEHFARILRLAEGWGLRDVGELQERLMAKRSRVRGAGTLPEAL